MMARFIIRSPLDVQEAVRRIVTAEEHRVPFTTVKRDGRRIVATTSVGPIRFDDTMVIADVDVREDHARGTIIKEGPVLLGTIRFAVTATEGGCVVGWDQNIRGGRWSILNPLLRAVMFAGYRISLGALLR